MRTLQLLLLALALPATAATPPATPTGPPPIIDMHVHALWWEAGLVEPLTGVRGAATPEQLQRETLEAFKRYNIVKAVVSGEHALEYKTAAPDRVLAGLAVGSVLKGELSPDAQTVRRQIAARGYEAIAEVAAQYDGIAPNDPRLEPYFAAAEALDLPLGIHIGLGPPGAPYIGYPKYRMAFSNPLLLEDVLLKHPKLRIYVMHAGWPMID